MSPLDSKTPYLWTTWSWKISCFEDILKSSHVNIFIFKEYNLGGVSVSIIHFEPIWHTTALPLSPMKIKNIVFSKLRKKLACGQFDTYILQSMRYESDRTKFWAHLSNNSPIRMVIQNMGPTWFFSGPTLANLVNLNGDRRGPEVPGATEPIWC